MNVYLTLLEKILQAGTERQDRTGVGTKSLFGYQLRHNLGDGFPLLTTKKLHVKSIISELIWFLRGDTNIKWLNAQGVSIWDEWADENGDLGPVYGAQWRRWLTPEGQHIDQIKNLVDGICNDPYSRRLIVTAWHPGQIEAMALAPCHCLVQFYVSDNKLSCQLYQRSADIFLGVPFNIASYALLTHIIAQVCDLQVGEFIHTFGDVHLYLNHIEQARVQLTRTPRALPKLVISSKKTVADLHTYLPTDFTFVDYDPYPTIKATVAV